MMRLLDLYCGAGGAAMGYHRAGFDEIVGVDVEPMPRYPFEFVRGDVPRMLAENPRSVIGFDAIHASPPCQASTALTKGTNRATRSHLHVDLIGRTRVLLSLTGLPYVIENVQGAKLRPDVTLCGEMFGLPIIRHRMFELGGWSMPQPEHRPHRGRVRGWRHGRYYDGPYLAVYGDGGGKASAQEAADALGIGWTLDRGELREAIPPAYTEHIGRQLVAAVSR